MLDGIRHAIVHLEERIDRMDCRFGRMEQRLAALDGDRSLDKIDRRFDALEAKMSRQFVWLVGMQVTTLAAVVAAFATMMAALIGR